MAQGTARRHGGLPAQGRARPMPDLYFLFLFRISKLHFLTSQLGWTDGPTDPLPLAHSMPLSLAPHCFPVSSGRVAMATMAKRAQSCCHSRRHSLFPSLLLYSKPRPAQAGRKPDVSSVVSYVKRRRQGPRVRIWNNSGFQMRSQDVVLMGCSVIHENSRVPDARSVSLFFCSCRFLVKVC